MSSTVLFRVFLTALGLMSVSGGEGGIAGGEGGIVGITGPSEGGSPSGPRGATGPTSYRCGPTPPCEDPYKFGGPIGPTYRPLCDSIGVPRGSGGCRYSYGNKPTEPIGPDPICGPTGEPRRDDCCPCNADSRPAPAPTPAPEPEPETCRSIWCYNGGTCTDIAPDVLGCVCKTGYTGNKCQHLHTVTPDVPWDVLPCDIERSTGSDADCTVEQRNDDDFDWSWGTGRTPSGARRTRYVNREMLPMTGPYRAKEGDTYMFIEATGKRSNDFARVELSGTDFEQNEVICLSFWFSMNGYHIGQLKLYLDEDEEVNVWEMKGDMGEEWTEASIQLNLDNATRTNIILEGVRGTGYTGDIAVDDIQVVRGPCQNISSSYLWGCDFETSRGALTMCGMEQSHDDEFDWTIRNGPTPSRRTGPDRAYNGDYYIYIEASKPRRLNDTAIIKLPPLGRLGALCLEFHYSMNGFHTGTLKVLRMNGDRIRSVAWSLSGRQRRDGQWMAQQVTVENMGRRDQVAFLGLRGKEFSGDIALDNIRVILRRCPRGP